VRVLFLQCLLLKQAFLFFIKVINCYRLAKAAAASEIQVIVLGGF